MAFTQKDAWFFSKIILTDDSIRPQECFEVLDYIYSISLVNLLCVYLLIYSSNTSTKIILAECNISVMCDDWPFWEESDIIWNSSQINDLSYTINQNNQWWMLTIDPLHSQWLSVRIQLGQSQLGIGKWDLLWLGIYLCHRGSLTFYTRDIIRIWWSM